MMVLYLNGMGRNSGGFGIGTETEAAGGSPLSQMTGKKRNRNFGSAFVPETKMSLI
jgi:hypothetical protein